MKQIRKWSRILHRDIGFFFIGASLIYGISGIALNHLNDWNPNYSVRIVKTHTEEDLQKKSVSAEKIKALLLSLNLDGTYKSYNYVEKNTLLRIYLKGRSSVTVYPASGKVAAEIVKKRPVFFETVHLHYNPGSWWTWFSDIFAGALVFLALSSLFMIKGKKGVRGRGGIYVLAGIIIPVLFLIFS